ncbi:MAG TPA: DUF1697 domain-containing protein [Sphingobacteriaceae bacterium]|nr:DUF1697 domain-containing protein [Sphingobacteriaceae bacterium]
MKLENVRNCAFLRGVNVRGTNMRMSEVCTVFENEGVKDVTSVLASGNIIFSTSGIEGETGNLQSQIKMQLEKALSTHFDYEAHLFIKTKTEIESILNNNPFTPDPAFHIYSFVGLDGIEKILISEFEKSAKSAGEEGRIISGNFYWKIPKGDTLGSEFGKILGRKHLKDQFTSRNINTIEKVLKKM